MLGTFTAAGREQWLTAYDLRTGKFRWQRALGGEQGDTPCTIRSAPLIDRERIVVVTDDRSQLRLVCLAAADGTTVWSSVLCETSAQTLSEWATMQLATDGSSIYVATGAGVVVAVEALGGQVRWATTYPRRPTTAAPAAARGLPPQVGRVMVNRPNVPRAAEPPPGFDEHLACVWKNLLLVAANDAEMLFALDRDSGRLAWEAPLKTPERGFSRYWLGIDEERCYLAGTQVVRCHRLAGGRLEWERPLPASRGRGVLTAGGLYLPQQGSIVKLERTTGATVAEIPVALPEGEPVGNLATDGRTMWVAQPARVAALAPGLEVNRGDSAP
jgi:outer membrane protein assembly factor BamB